jgi:hypothetical protein
MQKRRSAGNAAAAAGLALVATCSSSVLAQGFFSSPPMAPYEESLSIELGGIVNRFNSSVRVDGQTGRGSVIDLENNGLDRNLSTFEGALTWRFARRHRLDFQYYEADRSGSRTYSTSIDIGDQSFPLGASVSVDAKTQFGSMSYRYSFVQQPDFEAAVVLGIYGGKVRYDIDAVGTSGGVQRSYHVTRSTSLPLPMLGLSADWHLDRRWKLSGTLQGIAAEVGDVDGQAFVASASLDYMVSRNFGLGVRYAYADVEADIAKSSFLGNVNWTSNSVSLYGRFVF